MAADHVEVLPPDLDVAARWPELAPLTKGEGWAVFAGAGDGAWWIVFDDVGLAEDEDALEAVDEPLLRAERYDDRARWSAACAAILRGEASIW